MKLSWTAKLRELLVVAPNPDSDIDPNRPSYERLAIPHSFKPQLSLGEAVISAAGAFLRIFLGSVLFAVWGAYTLHAWSSIHNLFLRGGIMLVLFVLFVVSFALLLLGVSALVRKCIPRSSKR